MSRTHVSVVIPAYNAESTIKLCLEALTRQSRPPDEVVVVDNACTDGTARVARAFQKELAGLRLVQEPCPGEARARNCGVRWACGEVLAFTDADCVPDSQWLARVEAAFEQDPLCAAVAGEVTGYRPRRLVEKYLSVAAFPTPSRSCAIETPCFPSPTFYTANLSVRRTAVEAVGGFDEDLPVGCDVDFCVRLLRAGLRLRFEPRAVVAHQHRPTFGQAARRLFQYGNGLPGWFRKHAPGGFWVTLPGGRAWRVAVVRQAGWLNLATPDRVVVALAAAAAWEPQVTALLLVYLARLAWSLRTRARLRGVRLSSWELAAVTALHVLEFPVFTAGCVVGSLRRRVLCVV